MKGPERPADMLGEGRPDDAVVQLERERLQEVYKQRRDYHVWTLALGVGLLFAAPLFYWFAIGGALMVVYGAAMYLYWNRRMKKVYDPWDDEEIDRWERENFGT